jgi:hypothetical protein
MSVLWRAGVASRDEFQAVQLGQHEETLRTLIIGDDPGNDHQYTFFAFVLVSPKDNQVYQSLVTQPVEIELYGSPGFDFVFGGCVWRNMLSSTLDLKQFPFVFKRQGTLHLLRVPVDQYDPVMDVFKQRGNRRWKVKG